MKILVKTETFLTTREVETLKTRIEKSIEDGFAWIPPCMKVMVITDSGEVYII